MQIRLRPLLGGLLSHCPPIYERLRSRNEGSSGDAEHCYGVWMGHLERLRRAGFPGAPHTVLELGPGGSLGTGLAVLLSGAERCWALDVENFISTERNLRVLADLVELFRTREAKPMSGEGAPLVASRELDGYLAPERLADIEQALRAVPGATTDSRVFYASPWRDPSVLPEASVDLIISQSVLEHSTEPAALYSACARWLRPGGWMSHKIDLGSHGVTHAWNGHWSVGERAWRLLVGRRPYLINRSPASGHLDMLEAAGFEVVRVERKNAADGIPRRTLAKRFRSMPDDDLCCSVLSVVARKPLPS